MRLGTTVSLLAGIGVLLVFAAILALTFTETMRAQSWPETRCTVHAAHAVIHRDPDGGDTWDVRVDWSYEVGGTHYEIDKGMPEVFGLAYDEPEAEAIATEYARAGEVPCYYDPDNPRDCKLDRSLPPTSAIVFAILVALGLIGTVVALVVTTVRRRRSTS